MQYIFKDTIPQQMFNNDILLTERFQIGENIGMTILVSLYIIISPTTNYSHTAVHNTFHSVRAQKTAA